MEGNCNWHFDNHSGIDKGPNNPLEENFKAHPYYSIVREAIQNSLDAINDTSKPVRVTFKFGELDRRDFPNLIENLRDHIIWSMDYWINNPDAQRKFREMLEYLDGKELGLRKIKIPFLKVSDYNTKGMVYSPDDTSSTFYAFLKSEGNSAKSDTGSGGSFGFGKAAYFSLSPFKTIVVSTRNVNNEVIFEGATVLATHRNSNNEKLTAYGFYNCEGNQPVTTEEEIPDEFIRNEIGTDIYIIGLWEENERKKNMIKSVLNNFWLAIHNEKLIVEVDEDVIDKNSIWNFINEYYENEFETGKTTEINNWNPKPYYKAVRNYDLGINNNEYFLFEKELETTGKVKLYVYLNKGLPNRIAYFRKPLMLVYKQTKNKLKGYVAVFVCEDERGNEILKKMENPAHNEWKIENFQEAGKPKPIARKIKNEIADFINEKLEQLSGVNTSNKITIEGLEEYLNIPGELLGDDEDFDYKGENENIYNGEMSSISSEEETGVQTTTKEEVRIKPGIKMPEKVKSEFEGNFDESGEETGIFVGGNDNNGKGGTERGKKGNQLENENVDENGEQKLKKPINIKFRVVVSQNKHILILNSLYPIDDVEIEIFAGTDNGENEVINIIGSSDGTIVSNRIKDLRLNSGKNILEVQFEDNISHSLNLKAYELQ